MRKRGSGTLRQVSIRSYFIGIFVLLYGLSDQSSVFGQELQTKNINVCRNSPQGISHIGTSDVRYNTYKTKYTNCTYLDGSLEIVFLDGEDNYDLSFLKDIREITGYVLIVAVYADYIPLTGLRIVRGMQLFDGQYSMHVALNYKEFTPGVGLKELGLVSLQEILRGHVFFHNNVELCHENTIEWRDILPDKYHYVNNGTIPKRRTCEPCSNSCLFNNTLHCWGPGPEKCQQMTKIGCSEQCGGGRCSGGQAKDCCAEECAVGCTGGTKADCLACKAFENDGVCELNCPPPFVYSQKLFRDVPNPDFKYSYGSLCVKSCPSHLIPGETACLLECDPGYVIAEGKCKKCDGPCPKKCNGSDGDGVNSHNIHSFANCTFIQGNIKILSSAFSGDSFHHILPMTVDQFSVFESVQEVSDYIQIQAEHPEFTSLGFFRNLRIIHGQKFIGGTQMALQVYNTSIKSLDLVSLQSISNGNIVVANNAHLCLADTVNWTRIAGKRIPGNGPELKILVRQNRNTTQCAKDGASCSPECSSNGCWGPGSDHCALECANFRLKDKCIPSCNASLIYQFSDTECRPCHEECKSGCTNNLSSNCDECLHVKDGPYCMPACPETKYPDDSKICQYCHANCENGCTGSRNDVGPGGCKSCAIAKFTDDMSYDVVECLTPDSECEVGYYKKWRLGAGYGPMAGKQGCIKCHKECLECDGPGNTHDCSLCLHFKEDGKCVSNCSADHYSESNSTQSNVECVKCHARCKLGCTGPTSYDCHLCKEYVVYIDPKDPTQGFECMETCPDYASEKVTEFNEAGDLITICISDEPSRMRKQAIILGCVLGGLVAMTVIIFIIVIVARKRAKTRALKLDMENKMKYGYTGQEMEPMSPSGAKPDMSKIRIIKESELKRGGILGSGAFGTVFKGLWVPENDDCKIIVAIKVLLEGTSPNQNEELISEARIMASVENDYCIRILAFCMASQMMIITELMPLGCLLDFVRCNKKAIGSRRFLEWCSQIAQGMAYLEEKNIVHRDLAARNVLVQNANHIRITDFGLSKLLDHNENVVTYTGGKMPIKWLALESIQHKLFTHQSDVWSYGVTLWELFTYGQRPYENTDARSIPDLLERGERLLQPSICTLDVYKILIKCWVLDSSCRPTFKQLADEFEKMSRNSSLYLIIRNDGEESLPQYNYDAKVVLRSLSLNDPEGPENIVSADDYLNPVGTFFPSNGSSTSERASNGGSDIKRAKKEKEKANNQSSPWREQSIGGRRKNSRYCSDPCKEALRGVSLQNRIFGPEDNAVTYNNINPTETTFPQEDYLEPVQSGPPVKYLDLAFDSESENQNSNDSIDETNENLLRPGEQMGHPVSCISNPEYFDVLTFAGVNDPASGLQNGSVQQEPSHSKPYYNNLDDERTRPLLLS